MTFDGLTLSVLVKELSYYCLHSQIQKLQHIDKHTLLLKLSTQSGHKDLLITVGAQPNVYLSSGIEDLPKEPSGLCMFLRKHLEGGRITSIEQINDDRILRIHVDRLHLNGNMESREIIIELMGKLSNCIITEKDQIIESLVHVTPFMSHERQIAPKLTYEYPPNSNRLSLGDFDKPTLLSIFKAYGKGSIGESLRQLFNGIGNLLYDEFFYAMPFTETEELKTIKDEDLLTFCERALVLYQAIKASNVLYEYKNSKGKYVYSPIILDSLGEPLSICTDVSSMIEKSSRKQGLIQTTQQQLMTLLKQAIKKEKNRFKKIEGELKESEKANLYKEYGDLLMINAYLPHRYQKEIVLDNVLKDPIEPISIPLKKELTLSENGQFYYKLYNKLKKRVDNCQYQLNQSIIKQNYLESILYSLEGAQKTSHIEEIRKECAALGILKEQKKNLQLRSDKPDILTIPLSSGRILIGANNKQNEYITHKLAKPSDLWFHALNMPGSHVILQVNGQPTDEEIILAATYAAFNSKGKESSKVPVDYTLVKHIKKPPTSPLGYVIYTQQQTIYVNPQNIKEYALKKDKLT